MINISEIRKTRANVNQTIDLKSYTDVEKIKVEVENSKMLFKKTSKTLSLSIKSSGTIILVLIDKTNSLLGFSSSIIESKTLNVSFDSNGSPPVILNVCKSRYKSGHHFQKASTYGFDSLCGIGIAFTFFRCCKLLNFV